MNQRTAQADNITMSTGGLYSLATKGAKDVIDRATPQVLGALQKIDIKSDGHWCFSDMGCADGGTSLDLWRAVCKSVRERSESDIQIVYADQARNDFNALVQILHGLTAFNSYLDEFEGVHALESGSSFYSPILPADSLHLGFSATAMHWLSHKPCDISDHVHMVGASGKEMQAFAEQARADWSRILLQRARELKSGGRLVLVNFCRDQAGHYLGNTGGANMFDEFNSIWHTFVDDGIITGDEYVAMTLPQYYNSPEEFSSPFDDSSNEVSSSGLVLESLETGIVACPFAEDFKQHRDTARFAKEYVPTIRTWNESIYFGALSSDRPLEARREIIESYYDTYRANVEREPDRHGMGYVHAYMTIAKT